MTDATLTHVLNFLVIIGLTLILTGIIIRRYSGDERFRNNIEKNHKLFPKMIALRKLIGLLIQSKNGLMYKSGSNLIKKSEVDISVETLYIYKFISVISISTIYLLIHITNTISAGRINALLPSEKLNLLYILDWKLIVVVTVSIFAPDIVLLLRWFLLGSLYKREIVKLENILELLGDIKDGNGKHMVKANVILEEMASASRIFSKRFKVCIELYYSDKRLALERLKDQVNHVRFSKLIDLLKTYALTDKNTAMETLKKDKEAREDELSMTFEENMDMLEILAFISVVPILWELAALLMKPMLDLINQAFQYI